MTTRFDLDTAVQARGDGRYEARIDPGWFVVRGPNGGYVGAILLRALTAAVDDPTRAPRSLTIHYTAPPVAGPAEIDTTLERSGRSLTTVSARLRQGERLLGLAIAAFSKSREAPTFCDAAPPEVAPPERCPPLEKRIALHERYEQRWGFGALPFSGGEGAALTGGWIRLAEGTRPLDAPLVAALTDAWPPAVFARLTPQQVGAGIPTVDLTVHFRAPLPPPDVRPGDFVLASFRSRYARDGFLEEDGEIWSASGELLAHSRQLALLL
jgi:acyl-CoA thioesterase